MNDSLAHWINPQNLKTKAIEQQNTIFTIAKPFKHLQIKNFLIEEKAITLQEALQEMHFEQKESDLFKFSQTQDFETINNKILKSLQQLFREKEFIAYIEKISAISITKNRIDMAGTCYQSTDFLLPHNDNVGTRKIAFMLYLSETFSQNDGGALIFYNTKNKHPTTPAQSYIPEQNSFIIFEVSPASFHEVEENLSQKKRYTIGGWFHT